jgi:hypothetical protein
MENSFYLFCNLDVFHYEINMNFTHKVNNREIMFLLYFVSCSVVWLLLHNYMIKGFKHIETFPCPEGSQAGPGRSSERG